MTMTQYTPSTTNRRARPKWRRRLPALAAAAAVTTGGLSALTAAPALAATDYSVNMTQACRYTYNAPQDWADFNNPLNPFSWDCLQASLTVSVPPAVTITVVGGVDVQKYCTITYPGSRAVIVAWNAYGWRCRR